MKIFIICPIRLGAEEGIDDYIKELEDGGHQVYYPPRDTNQEDAETGGYRICDNNLSGIEWADEVHVWYRGDSQGTHFDLGMAFALGKKIMIVRDKAEEDECELWEEWKKISNHYNKDIKK